MRNSSHIWLVRFWLRLRPHAPQATLLVIGFLIGAAVVGLRSCAAPLTESAHVASSTTPPGGSEAEAEVWTCSMHPQIRQPEPGQCPLCGMDLILASAGGEAERNGTDRMVLSERARALARLRTTPVRREGSTTDLRLLGRIEINETSLKTITAWTGGRIDRLHVNATGERVRAGQVIATLYSPEVFAAHQDLVAAKRQVAQMSSGVESARLAAVTALEAARERLRLLGIEGDELAQLESQERPTTAIPIRAPFGGTVIERLVTVGAYVTTGAPLFRIANLDSLWIQLDAYESDLPHLAEGQQVRIQVESVPDREFEGTVAFIDPTLDPTRRTARVRVEVDNHDGRLKPGMFAQAIVAADIAEQSLGAPLVVPSTAPLFTGRRAIVYVEVTEGDETAYEPRTVRLGPRLGDFYPVVSGLAEGELVVSRGAFVLDADLQIRGGDSMMSLPDHLGDKYPDVPIFLRQEQLRRLSPLVQAYLSVQKALADDNLPRARDAATTMATAMSEAKIDQSYEAQRAWAEISRALHTHAREITRATSLEEARMGFEGLSRGVETMLRALGNPFEKPLVQAFCPMAFGSRGASWVQQGETIDNSYFGEAMRTCGEVVQQIEPGAHLPLPKTIPSPTPRAAPAGGHQH